MRLLQYSNTQHLVRAQTFGEADGIKGDNMAAFIAGGAGGLATEGIYGLLEKLKRRRRRRTAAWSKRTDRTAVFGRQGGRKV